MSEPLSPRERRHILKQFKISVLPSILKLKVRIHRICLSGPYKWDNLKKIIGKLKKNDKYIPERRRPSYTTQAYRQLRNRSLTIFLNPTTGFYPQCFIETSYPSQQFLVKLSILLPGLNVSSVEYAIDIFSDPTSVRNNFRILRRYLYLPYQNNTTLYTTGKLKHKENNVTMEAGNIKMYERGPDAKKIWRGGWRHEDVDRLRIELTAERNILKNLGIRELDNFIKDSKFCSVFENKFKFRKFKKSAQRLPKEWDKYSATDLSGHSGSFQSEYLRAKALYNNVGQYLQDVKELKEFYNWMILEMAVFEDRWCARYSTIKRKYSEKEIHL